MQCWGVELILWNPEKNLHLRGKPLCHKAFKQNNPDATHVLIVHDALKALHVNLLWKLYSAPIFVSLQQICTPSQLSPQGWGIQFLNFLHIHLQLMWWACQCTDGKRWMNYISERDFSPFIPCMMPRLLPCAETIWKHLQEGTNVLCDKDQGIFSWVQLQETKQPLSSSGINELALKDKVWGKKKKWEQAGQDKKVEVS